MVRSESLLRIYGYNASEKDDLTTKYRQTLLGEVLDLGLMDKQSILSVLEFNIHTHTADKDILACSKWATDHKFVVEYRVDPKRYGILAFNDKII